MTKVTRWYPSDIKPAYVGWYQRKWTKIGGTKSAQTDPDFWDGENWFNGYGNGQFGEYISCRVLPWRGITSAAYSNMWGE